MTKRDPHPDNELIARMQEEGGVSQQGRSGGIAVDNGTQAELERATGADFAVTRVTGSNKGPQDAMKGEKTQTHIRTAHSKESNQG